MEAVSKKTKFFFTEPQNLVSFGNVLRGTALNFLTAVCRGCHPLRSNFVGGAPRGVPIKRIGHKSDFKRIRGRRRRSGNVLNSFAKLLNRVEIIMSKSISA